MVWTFNLCKINGKIWGERDYNNCNEYLYVSLQINWSWLRKQLGMCQRDIMIYPLGSSQVGPMSR